VVGLTVADDTSVTFDALGGWPGVLSGLIAGDSLSATQAELVMAQVLEGSATPAQISALVVALRAKGETVEEMTGFVRTMRAHGEAVLIDEPVLDVVGTGGDRLRSINVSTLAALIAAGCGVKVCKHGNRAASSSVGTADVLEALGVAIELGPVGVARCVNEAGMGFCFAQRFHPAMRFAGPVRKELGIPTIFNFLGPLANPAGATQQLVGVSDPLMAEKMVGVLGANGSRHAMVLYADDGLDELSVTSPSTVVELTGDGSGEFDLRTWRVDPRDYGMALATMEELRGGDAAVNATAIRRVLDGALSAQRDIGLLNAAAALVVADRVDTIETGLALARASIDEGQAAGVLHELVRISNEAAASSPG
jgi:anthranilate phosphoribosyltransferase